MKYIPVICALLIGFMCGRYFNSVDKNQCFETCVQQYWQGVFDGWHSANTLNNIFNKATGNTHEAEHTADKGKGR